uniref:hybrid sensor histidine kinase/response regulator n=1 Tax=unclassified Variovorax TaxID=663243 RepID=UPI00403A4757
MSGRRTSAFQSGGGTMGARMRAFDWAGTALGPIDGWPGALKISVDNMLSSDFPACIFWGADFIAIYNDGYRQLLGGKPEALGQPMRLTWSEAWADLRPIAEKALQGESTFIEDHPVRADRRGFLEDCFFTFCYSPLYDEHGEVLGILDTVVETTGNVRAKAALADSEARLLAQAASLERLVQERTRALQDSEDFTRLALGATGGVGVWSYLVAVDKFYCDAAISELYGLDPAVAANGIPRAGFLANVHPEDMPRLRQTMAGGLRVEGELELEYRICHPDGSVRVVLSRGHTYFDDAGHAVRRTGVGIDMTRQRQLEEQLRQSQKMDALGQLTGGIAHDFNNMLQGIVMPLQLIRKRVAAQKYQGLERYIEAGLESARRAASITQRLLAFSRRQPLVNRSISISAALRGLEAILRNAVGENVALVVDDAPDAWDVLTDPHQFDSAVLNLTINARDAMPDGGTLTIAVANVALTAAQAARIEGLAAGDYVRVAVRDTGVGMSAAVMAQAFEPFFTTKPIGQGTGLGLSMIYGYARQSQGTVVLESVEGVGTAVNLYLPRALAQAVPQSAALPDMPAPSVSPRQILVVEDDEVVRRMAVELLRDQGYQVLEASDGAQGMALLERASPRIDLLLSDVGLPGPNGRQLADFALSRMPDIRVILMTGYAAHVASDAALLLGDVELMVKPFDADALLRKVGEMLGRGKA